MIEDGIIKKKVSELQVGDVLLSGHTLIKIDDTSDTTVTFFFKENAHKLCVVRCGRYCVKGKDKYEMSDNIVLLKSK